MPIFDRQCDSCDVTYSMLCRICDRDLPDTCPHCGHKYTTRLMAAPKTTFKHADKCGIKRKMD